MEPYQGPYTLQLCMGPSYFWRGLTHPDPPLFRTLAVEVFCCKWVVNNCIPVCYVTLF